MKIRALLAVAFALFVLLPATPADARGRFGDEENIHHIADVQLRDPRGQQLFLGYKTKVTNFLAGVWIEDTGYVLGIKGQYNSYYKLPESAVLARLQREGLLPNPLPPYKLTLSNYLYGFSAFLILGFVALMWGLWMLFKRAMAGPAESAGRHWTERALPPGR